MSLDKRALTTAGIGDGILLKIRQLCFRITSSGSRAVKDKFAWLQLLAISRQINAILGSEKMPVCRIGGRQLQGRV